MPAILTNAKDFLLNSDYPLDKAIFLGEAVHTNFSTFFSHSHGLTFTPLIKLVWSLDPSFNTVYGIGGGPLSSIPFIAFDPLCGAAWATSTSVQAQFTVNGGTTAIYIRMYGFEPSNSSATLPATASGADRFTLNTDYNYAKLLTAGVTASSTVAGSTETVAHNLGYYPQVEVWYELPNKIQPLALVNPNDSAGHYLTSASVSTTALTMRRDPYLTVSEPQKFHYRIYADEL